MEPYQYGNLPIHPNQTNNQFNYSCLLFCLLSSLELPIIDLQEFGSITHPHHRVIATVSWADLNWTNYLIWTGNNPCCLRYRYLVIGRQQQCTEWNRSAAVVQFSNLLYLPGFNNFWNFGGKTQSNDRYDRLSRFVRVLKSCLGNFFHCFTE